MGDPIRIVVKLAGKRAPIRRATGIGNAIAAIGREPKVIFVSPEVRDQLERSALVELLEGGSKATEPKTAKDGEKPKK
jgi:hypothetical protein